MSKTAELELQKDIQEKYQLLIGELYRSFDFFNKYFCDGSLKKPIITIQGDKRKGSTYGWFGKDFWEDPNKNFISELNLTAESLHREPKMVLETLLHEMAHLKNAQEDINDCTATQFHNKKFKIAAEFFGLEVEKMRNKGWASTRLGSGALEAIELLKPEVDLYGIVRRPPMKVTKEPKTIPLTVDISYQEKIDFLMEVYDKKRELTEAAIDMLYNKEMKN
jgi:hypothetical protein